MSSRVRLCCTAAAIALVSLGLPDFMPFPKWSQALAQDEGGGQDSADSGDSGGADSGGSESGGSDGGSDSGSSDSGGSDGGGSDGGSDSGGSDSGGSNSGGSDDGGRSDGASDSGASDGGSSGDTGSDGGASDGGSSDGGASDGGSGSDSGGSDSGGSDTGGSDAGGSDSGGADAGGSAAGGSDAGGSDSGGSDSGGTDTGGSDTGGSDTGGSDVGGTDAGGTDAGGSGVGGGSDTAGGDAGGEATDGTDVASGGEGAADGGGSDAGSPDGGVTYSGGDGGSSGEPSTTPETPAIIDAIVDLFRPSPEPEPVATDSGSGGTSPSVVDTPETTVTEGGTGTVSESGRDLIDRIAEAVRAGAGTIAPAPVAKAPAAVAVEPEVAAPVVEAAPVAERVVEPEPVQAATAPRIAYSSGGRGEPEFRQDMVVALGMDARTRQLVGALGFRIVAERRSALLGNAMMVKLRTPRDMPASAALARLREVAPEVTFDYATLYRPTGAPVPVRYAAELIGAPAPRTCRIETSIGLIDTGVGRHETLGSATIVQRNFVTGKASMNVAHGTAIASILVGDLPGVGPLAPGAALYSANVFAAEGKAIRADAMAIIEALDWMASQRVKVINLSLMGPQNALLEKAVLAAAQRGQILIAAAGNDGADGPPAYPAAYPGVIAVAAVDARGRPYPRNNRGPYVEISAPGVDVWGADARGGEAFWTGTSFAAPYVTAAVARDVAQGRVANINDSRARLRASARDMGAPGRDPIYGSGLLQFGGCSGSGATTLSAKGG